MKTIINMTVEQWDKEFLPIPNLISEDPSWGSDDNTGILFETYGEELEFVQARNKANVWTLVDTETGTAILEGYHSINRIGYFVCAEPYNTNYNYEIKVSEDM